MKKQPTYTMLAIAISVISGSAMSHGYVSAVENGVAEGRVALCKFAASTGEKNSHCGAIQYEPQSVEGPDGFPESGPRDGKIASAESALASALDEQTSDRWVKRPIQAGPQNFEWTFTANHVTKDWKYYITKPDWNPNQPLARASFDLTPFCVIDGGMVQPPKRVSHSCNVPERQGYQVILAVWDVGDTAASFYNVIDVKFDGEGPSLPNWSQGGQINPTMNLNVGDTVFTRVFDHNGENVAYRTTLTIDSQALTVANNWSHALATKINQTQSDIASGQLNEQNQFVPVYGSNPIYLKQGSSLERVEIGYKIETPVPEYDVTVSGLADEYLVEDESVALQLTLDAVGDISAELTVYNHHKEPLAFETVSMKDGDTQTVTLTLSKSEAGHHMLVSKVKDHNGNLQKQQSYDFMLKEEQTPPPGNDYDFVFPQSLSSYTAGTKVLATDGHVYQCKPFPYSGYCIQWSQSATHYEPAVGSHWQMAWDKL
ncbi:TPA: N-acetylglucosamine-binding protein GbpA [Vibrio vulnificus]|nr:N-acetylglucosamine-binding protein GbpA [Vibrio vulnificus]